MTKKEWIEETVAVMAASNNPFVDVPIEIMPQVAEALYNADYRKIDDKCVVMTKDDLEIYKKQARKEIAKEIWNIVMGECSDEDTFDDIKFTQIIKERYGIEVE